MKGFRVTARNTKDERLGEVIVLADDFVSAYQAGLKHFQEDQIDMQVFNQAIWESVKGANSPMPAPRHMLTEVR